MDLTFLNIETIDQLIGRYPEKRSAALPLLHVIQEAQGHISNAAIEWVAQKLELQPINIYELVTFYPMLKQQKVGKTHIKVCRTLSCALKGAYSVCATLQKELGCALNETTSDGAYSVEFVECLASCATAPVVQVNQVLHENVHPEQAVAFAKNLKMLSHL